MMKCVISQYRDNVLIVTALQLFHSINASLDKKRGNMGNQIGRQYGIKNMAAIAL